MKPRVLVLLPPAWRVLGRAYFTSPLFETVMDGVDDFAPHEIDYFFGLRPPPGLLKSLTRLKAVFSLGAGVDVFLQDPDFPRHLPLTRFTDPSLAIEMAQYVTMHVLMIHRQAAIFRQAQAEGVWRQMLPPRAARDTRIGILGQGVIGSVIGERLAQYGFPVSGWSRSPRPHPAIRNFSGAAAQDAFLAQCDMLVCVLPLTPATRGMLDGALFAKLPRGAWVINVARGDLLVEAALIAALDSGHLAGAVLDVFAVEPLPADSPLWRHPNITVTPHVAGITDKALALAYLEDNVARAQSGRPLCNVVDVARGY